MPIIFISLSDSFITKIKEFGFEAYNMKIENYVPNKKTYYVSPANSLCFMDGGIDYTLSRIIFPNIEPKVKEILRQLDIKNNLDRCYLPIGSSIIIEDVYDNNGIERGDRGATAYSDPQKVLIVSPTMLLPQNVSTTDNAYYATMAILYNILINKDEKYDNVDILFTSFCCGYGKMDENESIKQIMAGIDDYKNYRPIIINKNTIINEPNLHSQPKYYQNSEWFAIKSDEILRSS
jgi:O-acetyl-ADP-ribose deacetylase (regulator of RNase III)